MCNTDGSNLPLQISINKKFSNASNAAAENARVEKILLLLFFMALQAETRNHV